MIFAIWTPVYIKEPRRQKTSIRGFRAVKLLKMARDLKFQI